MFKNVACRTKAFEITERIISAISIFVMYMQNHRLIVPSASLAKWICLFKFLPDLCGRFAAGLIGAMTELELQLLERFVFRTSSACASLAAKSLGCGTGVTFERDTAKLTLQNHRRLSQWPTVKTCDRTMLNRRTWNNSECGLANFAMSCFAFPPQYATASPRTRLTAKRPIPGVLLPADHARPGV